MIYGLLLIGEVTLSFIGIIAVAVAFGKLAQKVSGRE